MVQKLDDCRNVLEITRILKTIVFMDEKHDHGTYYAEKEKMPEICLEGGTVWFINDMVPPYEQNWGSSGCSMLAQSTYTVKACKSIIHNFKQEYCSFSNIPASDDHEEAMCMGV